MYSHSITNGLIIVLVRTDLQASVVQSDRRRYIHYFMEQFEGHKPLLVNYCSICQLAREDGSAAVKLP